MSVNTVPIAGHLFTAEALSKVVSETVTIPEGRQNALVGAVDASGAKVVLVMNLDQHWQVQGAFQHDWDGNNELGAKVVLSW